jgi:hypothetical protein
VQLAKHTTQLLNDLILSTYTKKKNFLQSVLKTTLCSISMYVKT